MLLFKRKKLIHYQIEEFLEHRKRRVGTCKDHAHYLTQFVRCTGVQDAADISEYDIRAYLEMLRDKGVRGFEEAQTAFRMFYIFCKQKEYLTNLTHKTRNWDVVVKDRFFQPGIVSLEKQMENDMLEGMAATKEKKMGRPEKEDRNKEMVKKYLDDRKRKTKKWSIRKLGEHYGIKESTTYDILKRHGAVKVDEVIHR